MTDMRAYWLRILGAWLLVRAASALFKDAERLLTKTADTSKLAAAFETEGHTVQEVAA